MKTLLRILAFGPLAIAILVGALSVMGWDKIWVAGFGPADLGAVTFRQFAKTPEPNQVLICPPNLCNPEDVDSESPIYGLSVSDLKSKLLESLKQESNLERVDTGNTNQLRFIQRSAWMKFPDTIRVQLISLEENSLTLALYGQSQIGESDLGVNKQRAERWLSRLKKYETQN